ncbi:MAG TPA: heme-binding protein [Candidatus Saccharimonadales bacterium]|nr:heme-binding protein [Candidatus Saccharimonadales bacterium]
METSTLLALLTAVDEAAKENEPGSTDTAPVAAAIMTPTSMGLPVASLAMPGVKPASINVATGKAQTCLMQQCDTVDLDDYDDRDVTIAGHGYPFVGWDGGILLLDEDGTIVGSLGVSGRSALGDRRLAVKAATRAGFWTNFEPDGYRNERERRADQQFPGDL